MEREYIVKYVGEENGIFTKSEPLIRCKDCRYSLPSSENVILCTAPCESQYPKAYRTIDWFCAGGEQKEGDGNDH